jgi:hypothetical protein
MRYWTAEMQRADALLLGRVTYQMMESAWRKGRGAGAGAERGFGHVGKRQLGNGRAKNLV